METLKKCATISAILLLAFAFIGCDEELTPDVEDDSTVMEEVLEEGAIDADALLKNAMGEVDENITDEEIIETVTKIVELMKGVEEMEESGDVNSEVALETMGELFTLAAKLQSVGDDRINTLLEDNAELKAAIESLDALQE
ncbi:hypothetical protein HOG48_05670 [Candidatus Peregrinibacteria bacterium]|jgi:hypothetical protein|nr:hypothetical protein [Candidatus Peregrinibacteria bacterium]